MQNRIWRFVCIACILVIFGAFFSGCNNTDVGNNGEVSLAAPGGADTEQLELAASPLSETDLAETDLAETEELPPYNPNPITYEAEDAALSGSARIESSLAGFTGSGYVTGFENNNDSLEFTINIEEAGFFDLNFITSSGNHGYKENIIAINGSNVGKVNVLSETFTDSMLKRIYFEKGQSKIKFIKEWGWVYLDSLIVVESEPLNPNVFNISAKLVNPNASDNAKRVMSYLTDIYGNNILTGQYADLGLYSHEFYAIEQETGEKPAILGLDLMEYTPSRVLHGSDGKAAERAIEFWEAGGIVTMCWHWNAPEDYLSGIWYRGFYTEETNIRLNKIMNGQDKNGYDLLLRDIDAIAEPLKELQDAGVPILWRPLHEASGGWFWWGASGAEPYIELWKLIYDRLTNYHSLNNLIWLWNGQDAEWYPGDEFVDIIGEDIYAGERVYSPQTGKFMEILEYSGGNKMVVMSENGTLFDPDLAIRDNAMWGFFATWNGDFVLVGQGLNRYSEKFTEREMLKKVYAHEKFLSLEDIPDLKTYEIKP
ncbi:MAG: beta-mannosidase [Clostridiales bacterium]|nr:beta-mannosidase [Clostridiales bacterium]